MNAMPKPQFTEAELAWMAGFFDGEGYIGISRTGGHFRLRGHALRVAVTQVTREPLVPFSLFGGNLHLRQHSPRPNERRIYQWHSSAGVAAECLRTLRPYLRLKGEQADVAIAFQERRLPRGVQRTAAGMASSAARLAADDADYWHLRDLKKRIRAGRWADLTPGELALVAAPPTLFDEPNREETDGRD
jgi:hypothetical protein